MSAAFEQQEKLSTAVPPDGKNAEWSIDPHPLSGEPLLMLKWTDREGEVHQMNITSQYHNDPDGWSRYEITPKWGVTPLAVYNNLELAVKEAERLTGPHQFMEGKDFSSAFTAYAVPLEQAIPTVSYDADKAGALVAEGHIEMLNDVASNGAAQDAQVPASSPDSLIALDLTEEQARLLIADQHPNDIRSQATALYNVTVKEQPISVLQGQAALGYSAEQNKFYASLDRHKQPALQKQLGRLVAAQRSAEPTRSEQQFPHAVERE